MNMTLTKDDMRAIKQLVDGSIDERVQPMLDKLEDRTFKRLTRLESRLIERINDTNEKLAQQTAAGFVEVHDKINVLSIKLDNIGRGANRIGRSQQTGPKRDKLKRIIRTA